MRIKAGNLHLLGASDTPKVIMVVKVARSIVTYTEFSEHSAQPLSRSRIDIFRSLVESAEHKVTSQYQEFVTNGNKESPFYWAIARARKRKLGYVGGKKYQFEQVRECRVCGAQMGTDTCEDCGVKGDYWENKPVGFWGTDGFVFTNYA